MLHFALMFFLLYIFFVLHEPTIIQGEYVFEFLIVHTAQVYTYQWWGHGMPTVGQVYIWVVN